MSTATKDLTSLTRFDISDVDQRAKVLQKLATLTRLHGQWVSRVESAHHKEGLNRLASQTRDLAQDILDSLPEEGDTRRLNRLRDKLSELTTASPPLPKP